MISTLNYVSARVLYYWSRRSCPSWWLGGGGGERWTHYTQAFNSNSKWSIACIISWSRDYAQRSARSKAQAAAKVKGYATCSMSFHGQCCDLLLLLLLLILYLNIVRGWHDHMSPAVSSAIPPLRDVHFAVVHLVVLHLIWWWHPISRRPVVTSLTARSNIDGDKDCWLYNGFAGNITVYLLQNAVQHRFLLLRVEIASAISSWTMPMLQ